MVHLAHGLAVQELIVAFARRNVFVKFFSQASSRH
jgi:hypothetical protein